MTRCARFVARCFLIAPSIVASVIGFETALAQAADAVPVPRAIGIDATSLVDVPGSRSERAVRLYASADAAGRGWELYRHWPGGQVDVYRRESAREAPRRLLLAVEWRRAVHPMLVLEDGERLLLIAYDVLSSLPSGRLGNVHEGFDLYEIVPTTTGEPRLLARNLALGGIDTLLYGSVDAGEVTVCGTARCISVTEDGGRFDWSEAGMRGFEFVEVIVGAHQTHAIVRRIHDDRVDGPLTSELAGYWIARLTRQGAELRSIPLGRGIPFGLQVRDGVASLSMANDAASYRDLLRYEFDRMPHGGLMDFASNNLEGRIAWSQAYYLRALASLAIGWLPDLADDVLMREARVRLAAEVDLIARLSGEGRFPGYSVQRYSLDRIPLTFALHLGRIVATLSLAQEAGVSSQPVRDALRRLREQLTSLSGTAEESVRLQVDGHRYSALAYRRAIPFWADGVNVPFNYMSGYVEGLLALGDGDARLVRRAADLMRPLIDLEHPERAEIWRYWWARGEHGWRESDHVSVNTLEWAGNAGGFSWAHISYRSMDAVALLRLRRADRQRVPAEMLSHFVALVRDGRLLPAVNEELVRVGQKAALERRVAIRHARSASVWELQSQVWALDALAGGGS